MFIYYLKSQNIGRYALLSHIRIFCTKNCELHFVYGKCPSDGRLCFIFQSYNDCCLVNMKF